MVGQVLANLKDRWAGSGGARMLARRLENPRAWLGWAAVLLLHLAVIWAFASGIIAPRGDNGVGPEMKVALLDTQTASSKVEPVPEPQLQAADPAPDPVPEPQIDVAAAATNGAPGASMADILPPRPDPAFQNASPNLPAGHAQNAVQVMLTILVAADGSISDTRIAQSCGEAALDNMAAAFARAKWRFRAAMQQGRPVADWTTVLVRFAPRA
jgi:TonB family protein